MKRSAPPDLSQLDERALRDFGRALALEEGCHETHRLMESACYDEIFAAAIAERSLELVLSHLTRLNQPKLVIAFLKCKIELSLPQLQMLFEVVLRAQHPGYALYMLKFAHRLTPSQATTLRREVTRSGDVALIKLMGHWDRKKEREGSEMSADPSAAPEAQTEEPSAATADSLGEERGELTQRSLLNIKYS